ncbi:MAG TPA: histidine kinase dimerization/phosphoacceptor domain -containing protein [Xanthobacteraceae bacterium]|nr:histidine kinase dimerization/phosphoacceptor domain -containing protein [Xanthobacteraceae bacterium]
MRLRVRQQEILADFGVMALKGTPFPELLDHAAAIAAEGLKAEFGKILRFMPGEDRFLVCAGVGWGPGVVGAATVGADIASPAGYALRTGKAVISNDLENEERFRTPELLVEHGIRRAMNVILQGDGTPYGVLEVDSRSEGEFNQNDIVFLQGAANILGMAIERQRIEGNLRQALDRQQVLLKEVNHRVNNSLQIVSGMLHLHAAAAPSDDVRHELNEASSRIAAVARAHQRLYGSNQIDVLDLGGYLRDVCRDLEGSMPGCEISVGADDSIEIATDRAIPAALLVNELVTNIAKYAYPAGQCRAWVTLSCGAGDTIAISVRDAGTGLPADFDLKSKRRLGMRLVNAFTAQLHGDLQARRLQPGTEFLLTMPFDPQP